MLLATLIWLQTLTFASGPLRVAVVDTGLNLQDPRLSSHLCSSGHRDFSDSGINDTRGHGTQIVGLIEHYAQNASYCIIVIKYWNDSDPPDTHTIRALQAFKYATDLKVDIINFSAGGPGYRPYEYDLILRHPKTRWIVAAGNNGEDIDYPETAYYPASYALPNITPVGASRAAFSNYGAIVEKYEDASAMSTLPNGHFGVISGTSASAAIYTGKLLYNSK